MGKSIAYSIVSLFVVVIVVTAIAIPIAASVTESVPETFENENPVYYLTIPDDPVIISATDNMPRINNVPIDDIVDVSELTADQYIFVTFSCGICFTKYNYSTSAFDTSWTVNYFNGTTVANAPISNSTKLEFNDGVMSHINGSSTVYTANYTYLLIPTSEKSEYGAYHPTSESPVYSDPTDNLYFTNRYYNFISTASGTVQSMIFDFAYTNSTDVSSNTITVSYTENKGLCCITGVTSSMPNLYSTSQSMTLFLAPIEYEATTEKTIPLFSLISVLLVVTTVLIAARMITGRD